jgi:hypothetical protein
MPLSIFYSELRTTFLPPVLKTMTLKDLLAEKRAIILQRWLDRVLEAYPPDTQTFFRESKSPYSNPIGVTLRKGMEGIIDGILQSASLEGARAILEPVMKVRAVENLPPSQAGKFILPLREVVSEIVGEDKRKDVLARECLDLNSRISQLALLAMNIYSECREQVNRLRIQEWEKRARAGQKWRTEV